MDDENSILASVLKQRLITMAVVPSTERGTDRGWLAVDGPYFRSEIMATIVH